MHACTPNNLQPPLIPAGFTQSNQQAFSDSSTSTVNRIASAALTPHDSLAGNCPRQNNHLASPVVITHKPGNTDSAEESSPLFAIIPPEILVTEILPKCDNKSLACLQLTCKYLENTIKGETKLYKDLLIGLALKKALRQTETHSVYSKIYTLCRFAIIQAPNHPERANELIQEAIEASNALVDDPSNPEYGPNTYDEKDCPQDYPYQKSRALCPIADAERSLNLEQAIRTTNQITQEELREQMLMRMALQKSLTNMKDALAIIEGISDSKKQDIALKDIVKQCALKNPKEALVIALRIRERKIYNRALYKIYELQALTNLPQALSNIQNMDIHLENAEELDSKTNCLWHIWEQIVLTDPNKAKTVADIINEDDIRYNMLAQTMATTNLEEAVSAANRIQHFYTKVYAFCGMADRLIAVNNLAKANEFCEEALALTSSPDDNRYHHDLALHRICQSLASINIEKAQAVADSIQDTDSLRWANGAICTAHASVNFEEALASPLWANIDINSIPRLLKTAALAHPDQSTAFFLKTVHKAEQIWKNSPIQLRDVLIKLTEILVETRALHKSSTL